MDPQEKITCQRSSSQEAWLLAHVYSILEHEQNDLLSLYSACRIIEGLEPNQSCYEQILDKEGTTRSEARESLFQLMFEHLWRNFCDLAETDEDVQQWIYSYTMISKYYPSKPVTRAIDFALINGRIDFMNLAYLILLNEKTPNPKELVRRLLALTPLKQGDIDGRNINRMGSICLKLLSEIIQTIYGYFQEGNADNSTLMIDIQQWIIATLKSSKQSSREEIVCLLKFLNQVSLPFINTDETVSLR